MHEHRSTHANTGVPTLRAAAMRCRWSWMLTLPAWPDAVCFLERATTAGCQLSSPPRHGGRAAPGWACHAAPGYHHYRRRGLRDAHAARPRQSSHHQSSPPIFTTNLHHQPSPPICTTNLHHQSSPPIFTTNLHHQSSPPIFTTNLHQASPAPPPPPQPLPTSPRGSQATGP